MRHAPLILLFAALVFALVGCIEAMKSNGATDKPLLVDAAYPVQAPMLFVPCPINLQNVPRRREDRT